MPRGRGRKRGSSQSNPPRRTTTLSSHPRRSTTQSIIGNLRRSTRIAEVVAHRTATGARTVLMADVARRSIPSSLRYRSVEADVARQRSRHVSQRARLSEEVERTHSQATARHGHTPPQRSAGSEAEPNSFALDFIVQPPSEVQAGSPIMPAVTLQVRTVRRGLSSANQDRSLPRYFAVVSLVAAGHNGITVAATPGTLIGSQLADSVHAPDAATSAVTTPEVLGYVSFSDLVIRTAGTYQIRVGLMRIGSSGEPNQGASSLHIADSGPIVVTEP